ncbi:hypothetical protein L6164_019206 [Bauhinia variegata]|uniref:Uncharacterized protein n=1 Tax=Bauhinia variegata TaxID=167791 RepID=A0ACB9NDR6_BAUVA|nr:hypothetical protein L6164_019206 [Bauhinia variegata]
MGKHLVSSRHSTVQAHNNNPGCMWGILHILDNHHWHSVKKVFPHKKHYGGKHARYKRKTILYNHGISEDQQVGDAEAEPLLVIQHSEKASVIGKSSPTSHRKGLKTEDRSKDDNSKARTLSFHAGPETQQVNSVHHLESSDKSLPSKANASMDAMDYSRQNQTASEYALHEEKDGTTTKAALNQKPIQWSNLKRDISNKFKERSDVLEVFRLEKDLLLKIFRELEVGGKSASNTQARLTKSGSFPIASPSHIRYINTSTLKHKQTEIWAFPKGEMLPADLKSVSIGNDRGVNGAKKQKSGYSSRSSQGFYHKGWNQLVLHRFKVIKKKIKHVILEFTKNGYQSVEAIHHRDSSECKLPNNGKELPRSLKDSVIEECIESSSPNETKASDYNSNKHEVQRIRRTSSLNESLDRYTHLFEQSFGKDTKWHKSKSKSLKLTNEDKIQMCGYGPKLPRRNLSMPNVESLGFFLHEAFGYTNDSGLPGRTSVDNTNVETNNLIQRNSGNLSVNKDRPLDPITETEIQEVAESSGRDDYCRPLSGLILVRNDKGVTADHSGEILEPSVGDESFHQEKEKINVTIYPDKDVMTVIDTSCEDSATSHAEDTELMTTGSSMDESKIDLLEPVSLCNADVVATTKGASNNHSLLFEQDKENNSDFKYVKEVLEFTGFMGNEHTQMWQTVEQPLKPSLFKVLEASMPQETICSGGEVSNSCDHQLLFYLVNEVLLEIYERSSTYFPRPFSFNLSLHPMPKGHHLLKEVWARVNSYMSLKPELDQTLDDVVGRDLAKNHSWMNLQSQEEYVALELEEMIMEDLLDEVI